MNTQKNNSRNTAQQDVDSNLEPSASNLYEMKVAYAEALLDQVDAAQLEILDLQKDISLLQTMENALDLITENLAKVRRLVSEKEACANDRITINALLDEIRNLLMINMLVADDTVSEGHCLFRDNIIRMNCDTLGDLTLTTSRIPEIAGLENNDTQATLDSLDTAARTINRQYQRVGALRRALRRHYEQLRTETAVLMAARKMIQQEN